jgi:hypothetical protein
MPNLALLSTAESLEMHLNECGSSHVAGFGQSRGVFTHNKGDGIIRRPAYLSSKDRNVFGQSVKPLSRCGIVCTGRLPCVDACR